MYLYSLFRYCRVFVFSVLFSHCISSWICLIGKIFSCESTCISNSLSRRKRVLAMRDLEHARCFSLRRFKELPCFV